MINLLPDEEKRNIRAGRMNVVLLRYNFMVLVAIGVLVLFSAMFYFILHATQSGAVSTSTDNSSKASNYASVRQQATNYKNNLAVAKTIFSNAVSYTSIVNSITKLVPSGVVLDSLNLSDSTFGQQSSFSAHARNYADATKLKANFQSSKLFSNVFFQALTDGGGSPDGNYPVSFVISAKLNRVDM
ncbi:MAG: PilN domain-containing protein [Candidatus Nomurabacteria bacterium]|nr:MAG: PilN domain-containing protein [Candidatus Nomurabacteria bacterium]